MLWLVWLTANIVHVDERRGGGLGDDHAHHLAGADRAGADRVRRCRCSCWACRAARSPTSSTAAGYFIFTQVWIATNAAVLFVVAALDRLTAPRAAAARVHQRHRPGDALAGVRGDRPGAGAAPAAAHRPRAERRGDEPLARRGPAGGRAPSSPPPAPSTSSRSTSCSRVAAAIAVSRWKRESKPSVLPGERFLGAMRLGWQYVRESQRMKDALVRISVFFAALDGAAGAPAAGGQATGPGRRRRDLHAAALRDGPGRDRHRHAAAEAARALVPRPVHARRHRDAGRVHRGAWRSPPNVWVAAPAMFVGGHGLDPGRQLGDGGRAAGAAGLGARARHVDLPDGDHGQLGAGRGDLGEDRRLVRASRRASPSPGSARSSRRCSRATARSTRAATRTTRPRIPGTSRCRRARSSSTRAR